MLLYEKRDIQFWTYLKNLKFLNFTINDIVLQYKKKLAGNVLVKIVEEQKAENYNIISTNTYERRKIAAQILEELNTEMQNSSFSIIRSKI